jgi:homoserine dehydrogenase
MLKIALIGFGQVGKAFYEEIKKHPRYGTDLKLSWIKIDNIDKHMSNLTNDIFMSNSSEVFLLSEDYNLVVDASSYSESSKGLIVKVLNKGIPVYTCNKDLARLDWKELIAAATRGDTTIDFNAIPSSDSETKYSSINLNQDTWKDWVDDSEMFIFRGGGPVETAKALVGQVVKALQ